MYRFLAHCTAVEVAYPLIQAEEDEERFEHSAYFAQGSADVAV